MNTATDNKSTAGSSVGKITESNPYLQPGVKEPTSPTNGNQLTDEAEADVLVDRKADEQKMKRRRRHRVVKTVILVSFFASVAVAVGLYRLRSTRVEYGQVSKQTQVLPPPPNVSATAGDSRSEQAIQEALRLTENGNTNARKEQSAANAASSGTSQTVHNSANIAEDPFVLPDSADVINKSKSASKDSAAPATSNDQPPLRSERSSETSLYVNVRDDERPNSSTRNAEPPNVGSVPSIDASREKAVALPPFGSMLPVRTIGGLYTLRNGALVRLELTRDMVGNGWSMKRGTILVGTTKGGEYGRAYVSLVGFIDPQTGKLGKLGGEVFGGDGVAGLQGKSRQVDSRWLRVLRQVGSAALNLTGALIAGRGNGTVIISDATRSSLINPLSSELDGVIGSELSQRRQTGFVEVAAGTPGYVMVTDLPATIQGTDASPALNNQTVAILSDVDAIRPATGISEHEFAELIATGSPEEIKARLHRMSPEMRKIALAVLER